MGNFMLGTQYMVERGTGKFPPEPENSNHYWELSQETDYERVFTLRSTEPSHTVQDLRTKETLRDENRELMKRLELQRNDNNFLSRENGELKKVVEKLEKMNKELQGSLNAYARDAVETEKCQDEAVVNPDWVETDNLHKERMRLENEKISLENQRMKREIKGQIDYPEAAWKYLHSKVEELASNLLNRVAGLWVAVVPLAINEVIQWVTR